MNMHTMGCFSCGKAMAVPLLKKNTDGMLNDAINIIGTIKSKSKKKMTNYLPW